MYTIIIQNTHTHTHQFIIFILTKSILLNQIAMHNLQKKYYNKIAYMNLI